MENKIDKLHMMQNQVFSAMVESPILSQNMSKGIKDKLLKIGTPIVLSVLAFASQVPLAHADTSTTLKSVAAVGLGAGLLTHQGKIENSPCNIKGVNGYTVGGSTVVGGLLGNQIGGGDGRIASTVIGAGVTGLVSYFSENDRVAREQAECEKNILAQRAAQNQAYNYNNRSQVQAYAAPGMIPNQANPNSMVLYYFDSSRTHSRYLVTMENSPGVMALRGMRNGTRDVNADPEVLNAIQTAIVGLKAAYENEEWASEQYIQATNTRSQDTKSSRYAVGYFEAKKADRDLTSNLDYMKKLSNNAIEARRRVGRERAFLAAIMDNAAIDGFNLLPFANVLQYYLPSPKVALACQCNPPNVSSSVPARITSDR